MKKALILSVLSALSLVIAKPALAEKWINVVASEDGDIHLIDIDRISMSNGVVTVPSLVIPGTDGVPDLTLISVRCNTRQMKHPNEDWFVVKPSSVGESKLEEVCSGRYRYNSSSR